MPATVRCVCKSYCTTYDALTGRYTGNGFDIPRGTRENHAKADKRRAAKSLNLVSQPQTALRLRPEAIWIKVFNDEINVLAQLPLSSPGVPLVFSTNPAINEPFIAGNEQENNPTPNDGAHSLTGHRSNRSFLMIEHRICEIIAIVLASPMETNEHALLLERLRDELLRLEREKEIQWGQQITATGVTPHAIINTEIYFRKSRHLNQTVLTVSVLSLVLQHIFFVPRRALRIQLAGIRSILRVSGIDPNVILMIPQDPRTPGRLFNIEPILHKYICCPMCHKLYAYNAEDASTGGKDTLKSHCIHARTPQSPICNSPLWKCIKTNDKSLYTPIRTYVYQTLESWLARILTRPGAEKIIDAPVDHQENSHQDFTGDIWGSPSFSELKDSDGHRFLPGHNGEGRLVFSLSIDSFNPHHNKVAKQSVSSTGIWMVLLNFPPCARYLPENMYLAGVIPGPDKPSKEDLYPYLELVVNELRKLWLHGIKLSRTERNRHGRLFKGMLVPLICDMLAARQAIGFGAVTSHNFCTACNLDYDDLHVTDCREWPVRNVADVRRFAQLWRDAPSEKVQGTIFDASGIRWTPLLDLPYWDPIRYTVVDSMHALDLNLFQNHCRSLFQVNTDVSNKGKIPLITPETSPKSKRCTTKDHLTLLKKCADMVAKNTSPPLVDHLLAYPRKVLYTLCVDNNIIGPNNHVVVGTKWVLANNICIWREQSDYTDIVSSPVQANTLDDDIEHPDTNSINPTTNDPNHELPAPQDNESFSAVDLRKVAAVISHLVDLDDVELSREKAMRLGSTEMFRYICSLLEFSPETQAARPKRELFDALTTLIEDNLDSYDRLKSYVQAPVPNTARAILDRDVMEIIWREMKQTQLPSWITRAPARWGTTQHGKLSANNWRVICTIHLPITLIRLWGGIPGRHKDILDHYMDLVSAVCIANMKVSSDSQIQSYSHYIHSYIKQIPVLYPDQKIKPSHHAACHIEDSLRHFGPVHSHRADHYERFINLFHSMNTNQKSGELEETLIKSSIRMANVKALLIDNTTIHGSLIEMIEKMDQINVEDARGSRLATMIDPHTPAAIYAQGRSSWKGVLTEENIGILSSMFGPHDGPVLKDVEFCKEISKGGVCYGSSGSATHRNSSILFLPHTHISADGEDNHHSIPGIITSIIKHHHPSLKPSIFLLVEQFTPISSANDLVVGSLAATYSQYQYGGYLAKPNTELSHRAIHVSQIVSHFALTKLSSAEYSKHRVIHVLPLNRRVYQFDIDHDDNYND